MGHNEGITCAEKPNLIRTGGAISISHSFHLELCNGYYFGKSDFTLLWRLVPMDKSDEEKILSRAYFCSMWLYTVCLFLEISIIKALSPALQYR